MENIEQVNTMTSQFSTKLSLAPVLSLAAALSPPGHKIIGKLNQIINLYKPGSVSLSIDNLFITLRLYVVKGDYRTDAYLPDMSLVKELFRHMWSLKMSAICAWNEFCKTNPELAAELAELGINKLVYENYNLGTIYFEGCDKYKLGVVME